MARRSTILSLLLFALGVQLVESVPAAGQSLSTPQRFYLSERVRPSFAAMRERSATFRRQCERIEAAGVIVTVASAHPETFDRRVDAITTIVRQDGIVRFARITLRTDGRWFIYLPHELEHVIEQLDGVDLPALARTRRGEAWQILAGAYETRRAQQAGLRVKKEMREHRPPTVLALRTTSPDHAMP